MVKNNNKKKHTPALCKNNIKTKNMQSIMHSDVNEQQNKIA